MKTRMLNLVVLLVLSITTVVAQTMKKENFEVAGNCGMCKNHIEKAANSVEGVSSAEWNRETKLLEVSYDSSRVNIHKIHMAVAEAGYETKMHKANDMAYNSLPDCCKYERTNGKEAYIEKQLIKMANIDTTGIRK